MNWFLASKFLHVLSVILLFSGIIGGTVLLGFILKSRNFDSHELIVKAMNFFDLYLAGTGATLLFASGVSNVEIVRMPFHSNRWLTFSVAIFLLLCLLWLTVVIPKQKKVFRAIASENSKSISLDRKSLKRVLVYRYFLVCVLILPVYLMIAKPSFRL